MKSEKKETQENEINKETPKEEAPKKEESKKEEKEVKEENVTISKKEYEDLIKKMKLAEAEKDSWKNKYYQAYADMSNTRKQVEKENSEFKKYAKQKVIEEIIPVLDAFDFAFKHEPADEKVKNYLQGFKMIHSKFLAALAAMDVQVIEPKKGDDFDPSLMEAFQVVEGEEDNKVADVFMKGYKLYDHMLRAAAVIVTKPKEEKKAEETKKTEENK